MIFYFSGTGNTKWAASKTAAALDDQLIDIAATLKHADSDSTFSYELKDDEPVGFFFPVHGWRPPLIVKEFVRRLRINQAGSYCYVVCTAGDNVGEAVDILGKDLAEVGIKVHSAISLIMPESYVGLPFMDVDKPEKEAKKKREADEKLSKFIDDIRQRRHGIRDILIGNWPRINSRLIGDVFIRWIIKDTPFRVDPNRCISCGLCVNNCPVNDMAMDENKHPVWLHNGKCLSCFACYHHCPTRAIEYGGRTKGKGQYYFEKVKE
ncbi:EFR1 family ferrodoxin [Leyella stercorea]|uniref:EFR1 family ferrodoxin n=1 Tax=Leyella stercorea TaxID=363265 RepID=UPI004027438F